MHADISFLLLNSSRNIDLGSLASPLSPATGLPSPVVQVTNDADGLTYDLKRPSVFLAEIKGYLHAMKWTQGLRKFVFAIVQRDLIIIQQSSIVFFS